MKLHDYLAEQSLSPSAFAKRIGKSHSTVLRWLDLSIRPSAQAIQEIFEETGGRVTASDLFMQLPPGPAPEQRGAA